ncbi:lipase family protein [Nocardia wallacei]|uniref:lipase family protein n=1 Tax=Nocardia wallacei TaxID=480035 RepID=UPI002454865A|nr:lipase family protein [Nocardia wallacei]
MTDTDFYSAPAIRDGHRPGDLLRMRKTTTPQLAGTSDAWQIVYVSADARGDLVPASGTVISPDTTADLGVNAILVWHPPFHGLGGPCAPSHLLAAGHEPDTGPITAALDRGWTVAVADGENLGVTGLGSYTFLAALSGGRVLLDLARATQALPDLDTADAPVLVWGYGDGGRTAAAAAEQHPEYAAELDLRGVAAGAVMSDLAAHAEHLDQGPWAVLGFAGLVGISRAYHHLPLRHVLTDLGRHIAVDAETLTGAVLFEQYRRPLAHWCERADPWNDPMWRHVFTIETLAHDTPAVPVHFYHGLADAIVPVAAGRQAFTDYHRRGAEVTWREYDADHRTTAADAVSETTARLADYLTRPPTPATDPFGAP